MTSVIFINRFSYFFLFFLFFLNTGCSEKQDSQIIQKGHLIIIGGGKRPAEIMQKFVDLAGKDSAKIAVIPTASSYYLEAGEQYIKEFKDLGAGQVKSFNILSQEIANNDSLINELKKYNAFFFGGGDQNRLTEFMQNSKSLDLIKSNYENGAVVGGTSAGAAVMSSIMITGDGNWNVLKKDSVITSSGFGFVKNCIIDQHFIARRRFNRLLAVCMQNNTNGLGIDESTALWIKPDGYIEIVGESSVLHIDISGYSVSDSTISLLTGRNLILNIFKNGDLFSLSN